MTSTSNASASTDGKVVIGCMTDEKQFEDVPLGPMYGAQTAAKKRKSNVTDDAIKITNALFLTYPQIEPENLGPDGAPILTGIKTELTKQLARYGEPESGVIAREKHEDGAWHAHVYWRFKSLAPGTKRTVLHADLLLYGKHGNYQVPRSDIAVSKYCQKEGDYIWWGVDPNHARRARAEHTKIMLDDVVNGKMSPHEYVTQNPNEIMQYLALKKNLMAWKADAQTRPVPPQVQWLQGPPGIGKTTIALASTLTTFVVPLAPTNQTWWMDGYAGQDHIVFDNLSVMSHPPMDWFLKVLDAGACPSQTKGGFTQITAKKVTITSTDSPQDVFPTCDAQLMRRLTLYTKLSWNAANTDVDHTEVDLSAWKPRPLAPSVQTLVDLIKTLT